MRAISHVGFSGKRLAFSVKLFKVDNLPVVGFSCESLVIRVVLAQPLLEVITSMPDVIFVDFLREYDVEEAIHSLIFSKKGSFIPFPYGRYWVRTSDPPDM